MLTRRVVVPTTPTRLSDLLDSCNLSDYTCQGIGLQARSTNAGTVSFGDHGAQVQELAPGATTCITTNSARNVWVVSTNGTDELNVTCTIGPAGS